jgi:hypothetical protein
MIYVLIYYCLLYFEKAKQIVLNKSVYASLPLAARATLSAVGASPLCSVLLRHIFFARKNASHFSSSDAKKHHLPPKRYATFENKILDWIIKNVFLS